MANIDAFPVDCFHLEEPINIYLIQGISLFKYVVGRCLKTDEANICGVQLNTFLSVVVQLNTFLSSSATKSKVLLSEFSDFSYQAVLIMQ